MPNDHLTVVVPCRTSQDDPIIKFNRENSIGFLASLHEALSTKSLELSKKDKNIHLWNNIT